MTIGELARQAGIRPSAIRYYERLGILPRPVYVSRRRRYDFDAVARLAVVQFALAAGFTLREVRQLVRGFGGEAPRARWQTLAATKTRELDAVIERAGTMKELLACVSACGCGTLLECGRRLARDRDAWKGVARSHRV